MEICELTELEFRNLAMETPFSCVTELSCSRRNRDLGMAVPHGRNLWMRAGKIRGQDCPVLLREKGREGF